MEKDIPELEAELSEIIKEIRKGFRWLVGIIIVTWVTTIVTILIKV